jgi:hypothetical protein
MLVIIHLKRLTNYHKEIDMGKRGKVPANKLPIATASITPTMSNKVSKDEMRWRAEDALRDIERAEKHKSDPDLMKHVGTIAKEKMAALKKVCKDND